MPITGCLFVEYKSLKVLSYWNLNGQFYFTVSCLWCHLKYYHIGI